MTTTYFSLGFLGLPKFFWCMHKHNPLCAQRNGFPYFTLKHRVEWEGGMNVTFGGPNNILFLDLGALAHWGSVCINWPYTYNLYSFNMWYFNNKFPPQNTHNTENNLENDQKLPIMPLSLPSVDSRFCANVFLFLCPPPWFSHLTLCNKHFPTS